MIQREFVSAASLVAPHAVMPWPPRITPTVSGRAAWIAAMSRPSRKPGRRHGTQTTRSPIDVLRQLLAVGRGGNRDAAVGVQVVDVRRGDEAVHRGVDRRCRAAATVAAEVERGDHLVLARVARIDVDERAHAVHAQHREAGLRERAEVATGALHPEQLDVFARDGIPIDAFRRGVAARVVRVARVGAEPVRPREQLPDDRVRHAPHPAWVPPTRSATMRSA